MLPSLLKCDPELDELLKKHEAEVLQQAWDRVCKTAPEVHKNWILKQAVLGS